jgi:hypothetical protein
VRLDKTNEAVPVPRALIKSLRLFMNALSPFSC